MVRFGSASMYKSRIRIREEQERNGSHGSGFEVLNLREHVRVKLRISDPGAPITYRNSSLGSGFEILLPTPEKVLKLGHSHRIDTESGFHSSLPNRLPPPPHPQASVALPPLVPGGGGGAHSLAGEGAGEPIRTKGQTLWNSSFSIIPLIRRACTSCGPPISTTLIT